MAILANRYHKVILQGILSKTGQQILDSYAAHHIELAGGICSGEGGGWSKDGKIPLFDTVRTAKAAVNPEISLIAVEAKKVYSAMLEAISEGIPLIICLTKNIPQQDRLKIKAIAAGTDIRILGPDSFGIFVPGEFTIGNFPDLGIRKGTVGLVSTSKMAAFETAIYLGENGIGISTAVDIGNTNGFGLGLMEIIKLFEQDPDTEYITAAVHSTHFFSFEAIEYLTGNITKPIVLYQPGNKIPALMIDDRTGRAEQVFFQRIVENRETIMNSGIPYAEDLKQIVSYVK